MSIDLGHKGLWEIKILKFYKNIKIKTICSAVVTYRLGLCKLYELMKL